MKIVLCVTALLLCVIVATGLTPQQPKPQQQWEYKFVSFNCIEKTANELGAQGWEMTSMSTISYSNVLSMACTFKRPKS